MRPADFDTVWQTIPGQGWLTEDEGRLLWDVARSTTGPILEVGSYQGRSTCLLAELGRPVYAVDPFDNFDSDLSGDEVYSRLMKNLEYRQIENVRVIRSKIEEVMINQIISDYQPWPIGFAYLDGDHSYVGTQDQIWAAHGLAGLHNKLTFCVHDYATSGGGLEVKRAIESFSPSCQTWSHPYIEVVQVVGRMAHCKVI